VLKTTHEIRDAIHVFAHFDNDERDLINSRPFQRLRSIHQLALTHLVYPGATHRRFEHSIGVMELASRVFDVVTNRYNLQPKIADIIEWDQIHILYWRKVLRIAALCHDIGHLPFSHAAEDLLPNGWNHERLTVAALRGDEMQSLLGNMKPPVNVEDVVKLAVGERELSKFEQTAYTAWERVLAEIISGEAFGVDRIDYLLRDSLHSGVAYGRFDHYRLIDTLRILPVPEGEDETDRPALGVDAGGIHSAEALMLARYFMFSQLYFHSVRRIYDLHLKDFLKVWLPNGLYPTDYKSHLAITDDEVSAGMRIAAQSEDAHGHIHAKRIAERRHYKVLYERNPDDLKKNVDAVKAVFSATCEKYGENSVKCDDLPPNPKRAPHFPVCEYDGRIVWSHDASSILRDNTIPQAVIGRVYVEPDKRDEARRWLDGHLSVILESRNGES